MPSSLEASRDFMARAVARVRSGIGKYDRQPGPEIAVAPFDAHNVSTPAALIKLGTSIMAARRRKANFDAAQGDIELEREKNRAQIALIRAQTEYALGTGRQPAAPAGPDIITHGKYKGWDVPSASADLRDRGLGAAAVRDAEHNRRIGRVAAARAGLSQIDAEAARTTDNAVTRKMAYYEALFKNDNRGKGKDSTPALIDIGIDPDQWKKTADFPLERATLIKMARTGLAERTLARTRSEVERYYRARRERYQSTIDEGVAGFEAGGEADPSDPLNLGVDPLQLGRP